MTDTFKEKNNVTLYNHDWNMSIYSEDFLVWAALQLKLNELLLHKVIAS